MSPDVRIEASPEKEFFISMLIRDIELIPAIGDLVDNSVDSARAASNGKGLEGLHVHIVANSDAFEIADNCAGMPVDVARHYAFRFGRPLQFKPTKGSIGQFGVGMKRAIFKLGRHFRIESGTKDSYFDIDVDVDEWAADEGPDWSFEFAKLEEGKKVAQGRRGTQIRVSRLHPSVADDLGRTDVIGRLRALLSLQHQAAIRAGLEIKVNGKKLPASRPVLLASPRVKPLNRTFRIRENGGVVNGRVVAGMAAPKPRDERDAADAESFTEPSEAGWYIFCNDRLVVAADQTELTGWGHPAPAYHPQYRRFRGYLFLNAEDSSLLPWNTTKTGLDLDSAVFRAARQEVFKALQNVLVVINRMKTEVQTRDEKQQAATIALAKAEETPVEDLPKSERFIAPETPRARRTTPKEVSVQYKVDRDLMDQAMGALDTQSASEVGRRTFDYWVEAELE